jgi:haloacetate dehalogenase
MMQGGGGGSPVLLLHGFPQTHHCWRHLAPRLATRYQVTMPDLRGYGASWAPAGGPHGEGYSKREMAAELVELMARLGHDRFAVVGHDRGARVAYRLALDHPGHVTRVAVLNILPTLEQFERMGKGPSLGYWPWFLLAQPAPFPERLIGANPAALLERVFDSWAGDPSAIDHASRDTYLAALTPSVIAAMCADYRATFNIDHRHDAADRQASRRIEAPVLLVTGAEEEQLAEAADVWRRWADNLQATQVSGGHLMPEEAGQQLAVILVAFLDQGLSS